MSIGLMILLFFGAIVVFFLALGILTRGSGADVLDWDPVGRTRARVAADIEDTEQMLDMVNRDRRAQGLDELSEHEVVRRLREEQQQDHQ